MKARLSKPALLTWLAIAALTVITASLLISRRKPAEPIPDHPRLVSGVAMRDVTFRSQALNRNMQYRVFLPEKAGDHKLPVVYLLHGGGGSFRDWSNYSDVAQFVASGLLLVMPQGDNSYYVNAVERSQDRYEDYILSDLAGDVEERFAARTDRGGRAIVGVSMGGFGAIKLALDHPEKFALLGQSARQSTLPEDASLGDASTSPGTSKSCSDLTVARRAIAAIHFS